MKIILRKKENNSDISFNPLPAQVSISLCAGGVPKGLELRESKGGVPQ